MNIEVNEHLLALIDTIETEERAKHSNADFAWCYSKDGNGALGFATVQYDYKQYDLWVSPDGAMVHASERDLDKYANENWETNKHDRDYIEEGEYDA
jgi:hypothetical protein